MYLAYRLRTVQFSRLVWLCQEWFGRESNSWLSVSTAMQYTQFYFVAEFTSRVVTKIRRVINLLNDAFVLAGALLEDYWEVGISGIAVGSIHHNEWKLPTAHELNFFSEDAMWGFYYLTTIRDNDDHDLMSAHHILSLKNFISKIKHRH